MLDDKISIQTEPHTKNSFPERIDRTRVGFLVDKANRFIEQLVDEGIRISRSLADEESENPELIRRIEREKEDQLRAKERTRKRIAVELLLSSERDHNLADLSLERKIFQAETDRVSQLLSNEKLTSAQSQADTATRDQFLAMVSHDLKNPLTSIFMSAEVIRNSIVEDRIKTQDLLKLVMMIERNATVMQRMISHLLDAERITQGKLTLDLQTHKVENLLNDCQDLFEPSAQKKSIELNFENDNRDLSAEFDYDRILQVMSNLIGNALKFTPSKGSIRVKAWQVGSDLNISVTDSGPGIPQERQAQIFERFSQMKPSDHRGLGLGLYISKWIVEAHQGLLQVSSQVGKGSSFILRLPTVLAH